MSEFVFCRILKDCGKAAPGDFHRRERDFKAGEVISLLRWEGKSGLSYWTSADIDFAFIFNPEEVVEITRAEYDAVKGKAKK